MNDSWVFVMKHLIIIARKHQVFQVHVPGSQNKNTRDIMNIAHSFSPGTWILMFIKVYKSFYTSTRANSSYVNCVMTFPWGMSITFYYVSRSVDFLKNGGKKKLTTRRWI